MVHITNVIGKILYVKFEYSLPTKRESLKSPIEIGGKQVGDLYLKSLGEFLEVVQADVMLRRTGCTSAAPYREVVMPVASGILPPATLAHPCASRARGRRERPKRSLSASCLSGHSHIPVHRRMRESGLM